MKKAMIYSITAILVCVFGFYLSVQADAADSMITSPEADQWVVSNLSLAATYADYDLDFDPVSWAVRYDTCAASTNTVMGNVDGYSDPYTWDGASFSAMADVSSWPTGHYCFVFNPQEDTGASDVRLTQWFYVVDGVVNGGGHLLNETGKRKDWSDVSFGGAIADMGNHTYMGDWEINFHNVNHDVFDKTAFHGSDVHALNVYNGDSDTCDYAINFTIYGEWNGMPGYYVIFRAGDGGSPNVGDTARVTLYEPGGAVVYDTTYGFAHEFPDESSCVGTARTGLDTGNITIDFE